MCTRFYMELNPEQKSIVDEVKANPLTERITIALSRPLHEKGEICPTDLVPVVASTPDGMRGVFPMVFGFYEPNIGHPILNARSETADTKPFWKEALNNRRCAVPASYYFEWEHLLNPDGRKVPGDKYMMQSFGSSMTWLAGIYRIEEYRGLKYPAFVVLTRKPNAELLRIHDRMPVVLPKEDVSAWIRPEADPKPLLQHAITALMFEKD